MAPAGLVIIKKTGEFTRTFYTKGVLGTPGKANDQPYLNQIEEVHVAISAARFNDPCSIGLVIYDAFVDDWPEIEIVVAKALSRRLGWVYDQVEIRRKNAGGKLEGEPEFIQVASQDACNEIVDEWLVEAYAAAGNEPEKTQSPTK